MDRVKPSAELAARLAQAGEVRRGDLQGKQDQVGALMSGWPNDKGLFAELQKLAAFIAATRSEISSLRPNDLKEKFLPQATDELDAIVEATASATHRIMDAADVIMEIAGQAAAPESEKLNAAVMSIYEACTFQDITGQRVTKVVGVLKVIEQRLEAMVSALDGAALPPVVAEEVAPTGDASLLNGPAKRGEEKSQAEIDAIFGGS